MNDSKIIMGKMIDKTLRPVAYIVAGAGLTLLALHTVKEFIGRPSDYSNPGYTAAKQMPECESKVDRIYGPIVHAITGKNQRCDDTKLQGLIKSVLEIILENGYCMNSKTMSYDDRICHSNMMGERPLFGEDIVILHLVDLMNLGHNPSDPKPESMKVFDLKSNQSIFDYGANGLKLDGRDSFGPNEPRDNTITDPTKLAEYNGIYKQTLERALLNYKKQ